MASFYPTSKDSICGAHGWEIGSMHLCYMYWKIKQRIHGDDKSHKLIKIVHVCGRWMAEMEYSFYESLSPLFGLHEDIAMYVYFFSWTIMCPKFLFFWVMLLGHAIFLSLFFCG